LIDLGFTAVYERTTKEARRTKYIHISTYICINTYFNIQNIHAHLCEFLVASISNTYTSNTYIKEYIHKGQYMQQNAAMNI